MRAFVLVSKSGKIVQWVGAHHQRQSLVKRACEGLMGATDYDRLGNDKYRWPLVVAQGYKIKRATVELE
jgi:hypothetical protein